MAKYKKVLQFILQKSRGGEPWLTFYVFIAKPSPKNLLDLLHYLIAFSELSSYSIVKWLGHIISLPDIWDWKKNQFPFGGNHQYWVCSEKFSISWLHFSIFFNTFWKLQHKSWKIQLAFFCLYLSSGKKVTNKVRQINNVIKANSIRQVLKILKLSQSQKSAIQGNIMEAKYLEDHRAKGKISVLRRGHTSLLEEPKHPLSFLNRFLMCLTLIRVVGTAALPKTLLSPEVFSMWSS